MRSRPSIDRRAALTERIKAEAARLGFFSCGVARAEPVKGADVDHLRRWIGAGACADMDYMARNIDKRLNPLLLMPEVKSIVCVALNYTPAQRIPDDEYQIAYYAYGKDYHDVMKSKLHALAAAAGITRYKAFCDTAPVLERYWAVRAGIGWIGRNRNLIIPNAGSMVFLGELFVDTKLIPGTPMTNRCGTCTACIDACPTGALAADDASFDAARCLSYQTIENRGALSSNAAKAIGQTIYGCDRCQKACPWNKHTPPCTEPDLLPDDALLAMRRDDWQTLTEEHWRQLFKGSAVKRAKYEGLMRNIRAAEDNEKNTSEDNGKDMAEDNEKGAP